MRIPILVFLLLAATAHADPADSTDNSTTNPSPGRGRHSNSHTATKNDRPRAVRAGKIEGQCNTLPGPNNPIDGPCSNVMLVLVDGAGNELDRERTTKDGAFELSFNPTDRASARQGTQLHIQSGSHFYEVATPTAPVPPGSRIIVQLKEK